MKVLKVRHVTRYRYKQPVSFGEHRMMLRPRDSYDQRLIEAKLQIDPEPSELHWMHDPFGNCVAIARFSGRATELTFDSTIRLDHEPNNPLDFQLDDYALDFPFSYSAEEVPDLSRCIERQYLDRDREVDHWAHQFLRKQGTTGTRELLAGMTRAIHERFTYAARAEAGTQDPVQTLKLGSGSCRDLALLMMEAVRSLGLAARFVSGYLVPSGRVEHKRLGGESTHAWCEVYLPGAGWVEYDPTNGLVGNDELIRVAVVRDPRQAVPVSGT
ncbi:MAG TPA: transglutaminase family protein, partial [Stellaceae bacterium]|nr:transglutaminase family protein [Stellaceae bacterium]